VAEDEIALSLVAGARVGVEVAPGVVVAGEDVAASLSFAALGAHDHRARGAAREPFGVGDDVENCAGAGFRGIERDLRAGGSIS
jgi:hypothetical protein